MSTSQNLFDLIKSLTPAEKRYFKVFAKRHVKGDENNYVLLFNAIDKQNVYDEGKLLKKFENTSIAKHFSSEKNYLNRLILKAMNAYDLDKSVDAQIRELIGFATFFRKKRLYEQALKQVDKAKKIALKYEQYFYWVNILHIETTLINRSQHLQHQKRLTVNLKEMKEALQHAQRYHLYKCLFNEVFWQNNKRLYATTEQQITYFQQALQNPLLQVPCPLTDFRTQKLYFQTLQLCYLQTHQTKKSYEAAQKIIALYDSEPHFMKNEVSNYISMLGNTIVSCYLLEDWEGLYQIIQKLRAIPTQSFTQEVAVFETSYNAEIAYYHKLNNSQKIIELLVVIEQKLNRYGKHIKQPSLLIWYYNMASLYFGLNQFDKALSFLNRFFDLYTSGVREDTYNKAIFLQLILHWELDNHRLLESLIRSAAHYIRQKEKAHSFEPLVLTCLKKLLNLPLEAKIERKNLLQSLNNQLQQIEDPVEQYFLQNTILLPWLEGQISKNCQ